MLLAYCTHVLAVLSSLLCQACFQCPEGKPPHRMQEFKCEICGGESYWGRRAFERHFKEWKHQNGMRALGIPNNKNFFEVTQIKDALELWASIQVRYVDIF